MQHFSYFSIFFACFDTFISNVGQLGECVPPIGNKVSGPARDDKIRGTQSLGAMQRGNI